MDDTLQKRMRRLPSVYFSELKLDAALISHLLKPLPSHHNRYSPGSEFKAFARSTEDIIVDQNTEMHEESLKSLKSLREIPVEVRGLKHLCDLIILGRGVFSDFSYPPYIEDVLLDLVRKMVEGHEDELPSINDVIQELEDVDLWNLHEHPPPGRSDGSVDCHQAFFRYAQRRLKSRVPRVEFRLKVLLGRLLFRTRKSEEDNDSQRGVFRQCTAVLR